MLHDKLQLVDSFKNWAKVRKFGAGNVIIYQGEVPRSVHMIMKGFVKVYAISAQGEEQIVAFHVPGEVFPSSWIFNKSPGAMFFYEALDDVEVLNIQKEIFIQRLQSETKLQTLILDYFAGNYASSLIRIHALEQSRARDKLLFTMFFLSMRYSNGSQSKIVDIPFPLTHQNLASLVGLTRETTAMEMNRLKAEGIINYRKQMYRINVDKITPLMGEDSFKNISVV